MTFKDIQKGVQRRLSALKKDSSFSQQVIQVVSTVYPRARWSISRIVHDVRRRRIHIYTSNETAAMKFNMDKTLIHAALRQEGIDVRELVIK